MKASAIIPALNEVESIGFVLAELAAERCVDEFLVVDGGSTDGTPEVAERHGARVVREPLRGYGRACMVGATAASGDILVFLDADGANSAAEIPALCAPIRAGEADLVLGSRFRGAIEPGAMPWQQRAGNRLAARLLRALYRVELTDLSPFRAICRESLQRLELSELTYGWPTEMIVKAIRTDLRLQEVPVSYASRRGGRSKISGTLRGTALAGYFIIGTLLRHARRGHDPHDTIARG